MALSRWEGSAAARVRALEAGADDCLSTPLLVDELEARLRAIGRRCFGVVAAAAAAPDLASAKRDGFDFLAPNGATPGHSGQPDLPVWGFSPFAHLCGPLSELQR